MSPLTLGYLLALLTAFCWAILAILLKKTLAFADAGLIASTRMLLAFTALAFYFLLKDRTQLKILAKPPGLGVLAALFLAVNYFGFTKGIEFISASHAQVMIQLGPLLLLISGVIFFSERLGFKESIGIAIATLGYFFFYHEQLLEIASADAGPFNLGNLWLLTAALTWAAFASLQKVLFKRFSPAQLNLVIYLVAGLALMPSGNFPSLPSFGWYEWALILSLAVNTVVAYGSFAEALNRIPAGHLSLIITLNPILTLVIVQVSNKFKWEWIPIEPLSPKAMLGAALVILGVATAVTRKNKIRS